MVLSFCLVCWSHSRLQKLLTYANGLTFELDGNSKKQFKVSICHTWLIIIILLKKFQFQWKKWAIGGIIVLCQGIVLSYVVTFLSEFNFNSWTEFADSGVDMIFQMSRNSPVIYQREKTPGDWKYNLKFIGKLLLTSMHIFFGIFHYMLGIFLELLVFLACLSTCQIGYDFWNVINFHQNSMTFCKVSSYII